MPDTTEWYPLESFIADKQVVFEYEVGTYLISTTEWQVKTIPISGKDPYGFSALPAGMRYSSRGGRFDNLGSYAYFWSATESNYQAAYYRVLLWWGTYDNGEKFHSSDYYKDNAYSVRCLKD